MGAEERRREGGCRGREEGRRGGREGGRGRVTAQGSKHWVGSDQSPGE